MTPPRLVLIPGLGVSGRLLDSQRRAFPHLEVPPWLDAYSGETLAGYAKRMALALPQGGGTTGVVLGGVSFGGMVAFEMARHVDTRAVVLIASAKSGQALARIAQVLARLATLVPTPLVRPPRPTWRFVAWALGARGPAERRVVYQMIPEAAPAFFQWGLGAILSWHPPAPPECPVRHIHGAKDRIITASGAGADRIVPGAGHLLNVTHADEVNAFIRTTLAVG